jgi:hypothetical protein
MLTCSVSLGQSSIGVIGGARATHDLTGGAASESKCYTLGPAFNIGLPRGFGLEADVLYRRQGFSFFSHVPFTYSAQSQERANSWEFPMLLTYRPPRGAMPFLELGSAPRELKGSINTTKVLFPPPSGPVPGPQRSTDSTQWQMSHGLVIGGGAQFGFGRLCFRPVVRYTRWSASAILPNLVTWQFAQNQVDILLGVAWRTQ